MQTCFYHLPQYILEIACTIYKADRRLKNFEQSFRVMRVPVVTTHDIGARNAIEFFEVDQA